MVFDESAWVALGFIIFIAIVWRKVSAALSSLLDNRAEKIKTELNEAENLRAEAQADLKKYQKLQKEAVADAKRIVADAQAAADRIREAAAEKAEESIKRRETQAKAKIAAAEAAVISELRDRATSLAISASKDVLAAELDADLSASMIDNSLSQITAIEEGSRVTLRTVENGTSAEARLNGVSAACNVKTDFVVMHINVGLKLVRSENQADEVAGLEVPLLIAILDSNDEVTGYESVSYKMNFRSGKETMYPVIKPKTEIPINGRVILSLSPVVVKP